MQRGGGTGRSPHPTLGSTNRRRVTPKRPCILARWWPARGGAAPSPLGTLAAEALAEARGSDTRWEAPPASGAVDVSEVLRTLRVVQEAAGTGSQARKTELLGAL